MDKFSTTPAEIFNVWGKVPDDIVLGNSNPGIFSMIPHFFYEFNGDPNVSVIYAGLNTGSRGRNILRMDPKDLAQYMNKISTGSTIFCFDNLFEGNITPMLSIIYKAIEIGNIDSTKCNYFSGAMNSNELHESFCISNNIQNRINVYSCNTWEYSLMKNSVIRDREYVIANKEKIFLCFNRILRPHRLSLVSLFHEKKLLDKSYYSFFNDATYNGSQANLSYEMQIIKRHVSDELYNRISNSYESLSTSLPLKLNIDWTENANYVKADDEGLFSNSYFSLVTETYFYPFYHFNLHPDFPKNLIDGESIFFTEKIFKPIIMRHPFILASRPGSLKMLRKIGYKTFSPLIDESYDSIENNGERLEKIVNEVERLSKFTDAQWIEWQSQIKEIVDYNHSVLINRKKHMYAYTRNNYENQY